MKSGIDSMTEKRFTMIYFETDGNLIFDDKTGEKEWFDSTECMQDKEIVEMLNALHEENEQLKQFKENVFNKIDMHLRMLPTARDNEFNEDDGDPSLYVGAIYMLETLKKELEE